MRAARTPATRRSAFTWTITRCGSTPRIRSVTSSATTAASASRTTTAAATSSRTASRSGSRTTSRSTWPCRTASAPACRTTGRGAAPAVVDRARSPTRCGSRSTAATASSPHRTRPTPTSSTGSRRVGISGVIRSRPASAPRSRSRTTGRSTWCGRTASWACAATRPRPRHLRRRARSPNCEVNRSPTHRRCSCAGTGTRRSSSRRTTTRCSTWARTAS